MSAGANFNYTAQTGLLLDVPRFVSCLVDAVNQELITRDEARAWLTAALPSFAKAVEPKCRCAK